MNIRLHKFIASTGVASRRKAEELIAAGKVTVNGEVVTQLGVSIDPSRDEVTVNHQRLQSIGTFRYLALNKPEGIICTRAQHKRERTVYDIVPKSRNLVIAGRLDKDSEGLVLLTNDGALTNRLTHPRYGHQKEYMVSTAHPLNADMLNRLRRGLKFPEGKARVDEISEVGTQTYRVILHQGWKRQIRRMLSRVGSDVTRLTRVRIEKLTLGELNPGEWREVNRADIVG